ncbi:3-dehydroquinate synthase [Phycisphaera mikurensis]|uniref:3-dehydroquinate synthase n=1 Tax=Phycisphaera mikurensis (strain NBRC 102666 / KCTC 22515 / FYK2301M01) TaxID=1142394 RepID=I0IHR3_PHYMF|nr:3-dehydroquinate synthase [Phycisphaera mikurensis]MBB6441045.1 3-dehydroquinate synthase [Phycisphaera mikurensis]BAM04801.1 3-dehydroquinate synthase [Phycisphaera mikurensis NBRC 102666]
MPDAAPTAGSERSVRVTPGGDAGLGYEVAVGPGLLGGLGERVAEAVPGLASGGRAALISDESLEAYGHTQRAAKSLQAAGIDTTVMVIPVGERRKNLKTVGHLLDLCLDAGLERGHPVVALGGGIVGDVAGFVAASLLRGVPFVQCPTTLLAMCDASVGGKTGVNTKQGKNLVGAFWQPRLVLADVDLLATLPDAELACGLAECLKHGIIRDAALFRFIVERAGAFRSRDAAALTDLVARNVAIKAAVVAADERERGERAHLNLGHTFAHAIEATWRLGKAYRHGEAVAIGIAAATRMAAALGRCPEALVHEVEAGLQAAALPIRGDLAPNAALLKVMLRDKKASGGRVRFVLPTRMGACEIVGDVPEDAVAAAWDAVRA